MRKISPLLFFLLTTWITLPAQISLPGRMWADTAHAPFIYGVASGDPTAQSVILWSAISPDSVAPAAIQWQIATDSTFTSLVQSGVLTAETNNGFTAKVDVQGLSAGTPYYYRFSHNGAYSVTGRTQTAPSGATSQLRFGVASCSSIYSGYFGAYRHLAQRTDLNLLIHLGDYIYDFVDPDEAVRVPSPAPTDPNDLTEYRERQRYYLLDPDLRAARQNLPFAVMWDNHDVSDDTAGQKAAGVQAFWEFLPCRQPDSLNPERLYRTLHYGDLADIFLLDCDQYQGLDTLPSGDPSFLGEVQNAWLEGEIAASTARWHLVGSQKMFGQWSTAGIPGLPIGNGQVADPGSWDGYPASRTRLLNYLSTNGQDNYIFLTGDLHLSMATDVAVDPFNGSYDPNTGNGSVAVEFLPTSITRGNFDEYGIPSFLIPGIKLASDAINEHHIYSELTEHGYGILDIKPDSAIAQFWYVDILNPNANQVLGQELVVGHRQNHWARGPLVAITQPQPMGARFSLFPNPAKDQIVVAVSEPLEQRATYSMIAVGTGQTVKEGVWNAKDQESISISLLGLTAGAYLLQIQSGDESAQLRFVKE